MDRSLLSRVLLWGTLPALVAGGFYWHSHQAPEQPLVEAQPEPVIEPGPTRLEIDQLKSQVRVLRRGQHRLAKVAPTSPQEPSEPPEVAPEPMSAVQVDDALADRHRSQERDPEWSGATEAEVSALFDGEHFPGSSLVEADCRATFCRVVVANESDAAFEQFRETMTQTAPFNTDGFVRPVESDEGTQLVVYFAREGESLTDLMSES